MTDKNIDDVAVITGIGIISPLGDSIDSALAALKNKKSAIKKLEKNNYASMPVEYGGEISGEILAGYKLDPVKFKGFQNYVSYGVIAAGKALCDAKLTDANTGASLYGGYAEHRRGAFVSSGVNGNNAEALFEAFSVSGAPGGGLDLNKFARDGALYIHPKWILTALSNNLIFFITSEFGLKGDNNNLTFSASGGAYMLDAAVRSLREGYCDMALVCGADSILNWQAVDELCKLGILNDKYISGAADSMPAYSSRARGALPSEGGAALVIERKKSAIARGAKIYAEIKACGQYCVCGGADYESGSAALDSNAEGFAHLFEKIYFDAGFNRQDAVLVNLNASAIGALDECELNGLRLIVQKHGAGYFENIKLSGLKPYTGHCFSASFVLETAIAAAALKKNLVYNLAHESDSNDMKELFNKDFKCGEYNKAMIFGGCVDANFAGVALERV